VAQTTHYWNAAPD